MHSLKVLILEDHPFQLMALHQMLNANQIFHVLAADSVAQACQSLRVSGPVDIAICDLQMDGADGLELIRHLAETRQAQALIVLSCAATDVLDSVARLARDQGIEVLGCLQKPASATLMRALFEDYVRHDRSTGTMPITPVMPLPVECEALFSKSGGAPPVDQWLAHFQPKVSLEGDLLGVEALVRWQHPRHGLLSPASFMPAVEQAGLLAPLTWRVLELALQLSARVRDEQGQALPVAVNIAPRLLEQAGFARRVLALLDRHKLAPSLLTLEILEQDPGQPSGWQLHDLLRLRMQGCRLSIDDFGTGASNIQRLLQLPFCELKIPAEFVCGMGEDPRKSAVVAGALFLARRLSMEVVVEGVETLDDFQSLLALGSCAIQGYLIARPMSAQDLQAWMAGRRTVPLK